MNNESGGGSPVFFIAHIACCGGLLLFATGALTVIGAWLVEVGLTWLLLAAVLGILGGLMLRHLARQAGGRGEPRQLRAQTPGRRAWVRPAGERPEANRP